jgi:hypothetical protein
MKECKSELEWASYEVGSKVEVYLSAHRTWYLAEVAEGTPYHDELNMIRVELFPFIGPLGNSEKFCVPFHRSRVRPCSYPPFDRKPKLHEVVEAMNLGGWELAIVCKISKSLLFKGDLYTVLFPSSGEHRRLPLPKIRPHLQWVKPGKWILSQFEVSIKQCSQIYFSKS